ncbi:MAG TPA: NAD(P)-dependent oxidoreductase [Stellaceae bacterium]|nr:NAD(P)-dependent oxidoreductase [Stellaceae bacterium]
MVILGSRGFVGRATVDLLRDRGIPLLTITSDEIDLSVAGAGDKLAERLLPGDAVLLLSALTPDKGRDIATAQKNLRIGEAVAAALIARPVAHVVYFSSDAVYGFDTTQISESTAVAPTDCYGGMHLMRELMLKSVVKAPLAILRCTAVYGAGDTHNSYGPNRFRRQAYKEGRIPLGGQGEETRDHIYIHDVAHLVLEVLMHKSAGLLNLASGCSITFWDLATKIAEAAGKPVEIAPSPRGAPITYRHFDVTGTMKAFPAFVFTPLDRGLAEARAAELG